MKADLDKLPRYLFVRSLNLPSKIMLPIGLFVLNVMVACSAAPMAKPSQPIAVNSAETMHIDYDPDNGSIRFMQGQDLAAGLAMDPEFVRLRAENRYADIAWAFLQAYSKTLLIDNPRQELQLKTVNKDDLGLVQVRFEQVYQGVPVLRSDLRINLNRTNQVTSVHGSYIPTPTGLNVLPGLTGAAVESLAANQAGMRNCAACSSRLGIIPGKFSRPSRLVYQVSVSKNTAAGWNLLIDAHSGQIIEQMSAQRPIAP